MKLVILMILTIGLAGIARSQTADAKRNLKALEDLMNRYVSDLTDVTHYTLSLKKDVLDKETHLSDGESHHMTYKLKDAGFEMHRFEIEPEAREFYDFVVYWDIHIDGNWIATEVYTREDAQEMIRLLKEIQKGVQ